MATSTRKLYWIGGVGAAVLLLVVAILVSLNIGDSDDEETPASPTTTTALIEDANAVAAAFFEAWSEARWSDLAPLVGDPAAPSDLADWWLDLEIESARITAIESNPGVEGTTVVFEVAADIADAGTWTYESELTVTTDGGEPQVVWSPAVIHPSLQAGERFAVERDWPERAPIVAADEALLTGPDTEIVVGVIPGRIEDRVAMTAAIEESVGVSSETVDGILDAAGVQPDWFLPVTRIEAPDYVDVRPALFPVPGIAFRIEERRAPRDGIASHVVGTTGEITAEILDELGPPYEEGLVVGRSGLEREYETTLAGTPHAEIVRLDTEGEALEVMVTFSGESPAAVQTTIDAGIQQAAETALATVDTPAALVAIDPDTGDIKAAASKPARQFNRALSGLYPPGSTFKIVVAAAALDAGMTPDTIVSCPAAIEVGGREFGNADALPAELTLEQAFALSCNTAFIGLSRELPESAVQLMADTFGFNTAYDIGLPSAGGSFPPAETNVEAAGAAIGQGKVLASPLHMATVAAAVGGEWQAPTLLAAEDRLTLPLPQAITTPLAQMMRSVVTEGTGTAANVEGMEVFGKTGTAQVGIGDDLDTVAWFTGFTDELAFAVVVEGGESGGGVAAPLAAEFLSNTRVPPPEQGCIDPAEGWHSFQGGPTRAGCALSSVATPQIAWTRKTGIMAWLNSPVIAGDTVFVGTAGSVRGDIDDEDGVVALALDTGEVRWRFDEVAGDVNGVAVGGELVIATTDGGTVWALNRNDGSVAWSHEQTSPVFSQPLVLEDRVVVGTEEGDLLAISLEDGTSLWSAAIGGSIRGGASSDGEMIFVAGDLGEAAAFTPDGFEMWRRSLGDNFGGSIQVVAAPTVVDDVVVFSVLGGDGVEGPAVIALDRYVGTTRWIGGDEAGLGSWANLRGSTAVAGSTLVLSSSLSMGAQGISLGSGEALWLTESGTTCDFQWASPVVVGDTAVVARMDGTLRGYDPTSGEERWMVELNERNIAAAGADCVNEGTRASLGPPIQSTPAVGPDGTLVVGSMSGVLYGIRNS